jgi:hypothetical protein
MRHLAYLAVLILASSAKVSASMVESYPSIIIERIVRTGMEGDTLDGPGYLNVEESADDVLIVDAIKDPNNDKRFTHLTVIHFHRTATHDGGYVHTSWVYRLDLNDAMSPVEFNTWYQTDPSWMLVDEKNFIKETLAPKDPGAQNEWRALMKRKLLSLQD